MENLNYQHAIWGCCVVGCSKFYQLSTVLVLLISHFCFMVCSLGVLCVDALSQLLFHNCSTFSGIKVSKPSVIYIDFSLADRFAEEHELVFLKQYFLMFTYFLISSICSTYDETVKFATKTEKTFTK